MLGFHLCFAPKGKRIFPPAVSPKTPEELLFHREQTILTLQVAEEETDQIRQAIYLILRAGFTMAESCRHVGIRHQSELQRAISRIASRVQTIMA